MLRKILFCLFIPLCAFCQHDEEYKNLQVKTLFLAGNYTFETNSTEGTLFINNSFEHSFEFALNTATQRGCFGDVSGTATVIGNQAKFTGAEGCVLIFKIDGNKIDVTEQNCSHYHGMNCGIGGTFTKKELWPADRVSALKKELSDGVQSKGVHSSLAGPLVDCVIEKAKTKYYTIDVFLAEGGIRAIKKDDIDDCAIEVFRESRKYIKCE